MAKVATRRVKYGGKYYAPGEEIPVKQGGSKLLTDAGYVVDSVSRKEQEQVQRLAEKTAGIRADITRLENEITEERTRAANLEAQFSDLTNLRRTATNAAKGDDKQAAEAAKAAVESAEEAEKAHKEMQKSIEEKQAEIDKLRIGLKAIEE